MTRPSLPPLSSAVSLAEEHYDLILRASEIFEDLDPRLQDIIRRYIESPSLTSGQANWLNRSVPAMEESQVLYGDLKAIWVMFRLAGESLKVPKIRLLTKDEVFIQLTFKSPEEIHGKEYPHRILLYRGGWAGHGQREFIGWIKEDKIIPKYAGAITEDIFLTLQDFALDPRRVALASANKLGACSFCGSRLTDEESKKQGYGPICAGHYRLPWGKRTEETIARVAKIESSEDLSSLFTNSGKKTAGTYTF